MKKLIYGSLICMALGFYACNGSTTQSTSTDSTNAMLNNENDRNMVSPGLSDKDKDFVQEAGRGSTLEVALGNIAKTNANSQDIKDFGRMMVDDHSAANSELTTLLKNKGVSIDMEYTGGQSDQLDKLAKEKGTAFDKDYTEAMIADHQKDINLFKDASQNAGDADLRNWATKTLPVLQKHLEAIRKIKNNMK